MKFRHITDIHYAPERSTKMPSRLSHKAINLVRQSLQTMDRTHDFIVNGGDLIQADHGNTRRADRINLKAIWDEFANSGYDAHVVFGNHDTRNAGERDDVAALINVPDDSYFFDTDDGHRIIMLNEDFENDPNMTHAQKVAKGLLLWSSKTLDFAKSAINGAPTQSVTLFTHTPIDDFNKDDLKYLDDKGFHRYHTYRRNSDEMRDILEASGKNCLVVGGHSHIERFNELANVRYVTAQSLVQNIAKDSDQPFARWTDIERIGDDTIHVKTYGHDAQQFTWNF